jgi:hypothetical protein
LPPARTHFWIDTARGGSNGTGSSPRKYGTNGIMPELVNIGAEGCVGRRLPEGTAVWARATKNSVHAVRNSSAVMGRIAEDMETSAYRRSHVAVHPLVRITQRRPQRWRGPPRDQVPVDGRVGVAEWVPRRTDGEPGPVP